MNEKRATLQAAIAPLAEQSSALSSTVSALNREAGKFTSNLPCNPFRRFIDPSFTSNAPLLVISGTFLTDCVGWQCAP